MNGLRLRWWALVALLRDSGKRLARRARPVLCRRKLRGRAGWLSVRIDARVGLFAQLNWVLMIASTASRNDAASGS